MLAALFDRNSQFCSCAREGQKCGSGRIGSAAGCCAESTCQDGVSGIAVAFQDLLVEFFFTADLQEAWGD